MSKIYELFGHEEEYQGLLVGIEFEIESVRGEPITKWTRHNSIQVKEDGSLRNNGWEYVTLPIDVETAVYYHDCLYNNHCLLFEKDNDPCSERTSIHVHTNFSDIEQENACKFILMYVILEPYFFELVSPTRFNNIFCVPLYETALNKYYSPIDIEHMINKWHKYTAFNIKPLIDFGTIEFRHLQGTKDNSLFKKWLETIKNLYLYMKEEHSINQIVSSDNNLLSMVRFVFPEKEATSDAKIKSDLMNGIIDVQLALASPTKQKINFALTQKGLQECAE